MIETEYAPHDSPLRWLINSKTDSNGSYLVDIGIPSCQCRYFICEVAPKLKQNLQPKLCSHIILAQRRYLVWSVAQFKNHDTNLPIEN